MKVRRGGNDERGPTAGSEDINMKGARCGRVSVLYTGVRITYMSHRITRV